MTRLRFTLAQLMGIVLDLGFGFAAMRNADPFWASATYTLATILIAVALVGAFARSGRARTPRVGFAVFGWTYLLIVHLPDWSIGGVGYGPITKPLLLIEWGTARLQPYIKPLPPGGGGSLLMPYEQVSQTLGIILFGLAGRSWAVSWRRRTNDGITDCRSVVRLRSVLPRFAATDILAL
jgi:hypothetical protein